MREIAFVTGNDQKAKEVAEVLQSYDISIIRANIDLPEIQSDRIESVATDKVTQAYNAVHRAVIVDDAGMFFDGYRHFPGVYSKFMFMALGFEGLFKLIQPGQKAHFTSYIAYKEKDEGRVHLFRGECHGTLVNEVRGKEKFGMPYDNFFIPDGESRTFAEMTVQEKQQYDHRSKAVAEFAKFLSEQSQ